VEDRKFEKIIGLVILIISVAMILAGAVMFGCEKAHAHGEADWVRQGDYKGPDGSRCCGENDCQIFPKEKVKEVGTGFILDTEWGIEHISYKDAKPSEDGNYWRCHFNEYDSGKHIMKSGKTRCFFYPKNLM